MPMYVKMDIYQITARKDGAVYGTKKVGYHWFECGKAPELNSRLSDDLVRQNCLPKGEYVYCSTLDTVVDSRCPRGGQYK